MGRDGGGGARVGEGEGEHEYVEGEGNLLAQMVRAKGSRGELAAAL